VPAALDGAGGVAEHNRLAAVLPPPRSALGRVSKVIAIR
jgi:hypothetical protein